MSVKYEKFLQEQINKIEIEVSQLKGLVKALIDTSRDLHERVEEIDNRIPIGKNNENKRTSSKNVTIPCPELVT